jgi:hypothetical protein
MTTMKKLRAILLVGGVMLVAYLIKDIGLSVVVRHLQLVNWYFLAIIGLSGVKYLMRTVAWIGATDQADQRLPFWEMFQVRLAGEGVGYLSSGGPLFGDPAKVLLMKAKIPVIKSLPSVFLERALYSITALLFIIASIPVSLWRFTSVSDSLKSFQLVFLVTAGALLLLLYVAVREEWRFFTALFRWLKKLPLKGRGWESKEQALRTMEDHVYLFHRRNPWRWLMIFGLDLASHVFTVLEIYLILSLIGAPVTLVDAFLIEAYTKVLEAATVLIPAGVGAFEGGNAIILTWLGLGVAPGLSLALIRRIRSLFWAGLGLLVIARYNWTSNSGTWAQRRLVGESKSGD